ncbi:hypothetical protein WAI453_003068 [Rhynchosporium graminicola]
MTPYVAASGLRREDFENTFPRFGIVWLLESLPRCWFSCLQTENKLTDSPSHIRSSIEGTIDGFGFIPDLYYLYRTDPENHILALDENRNAGLQDEVYSLGSDAGSPG